MWTVKPLQGLQKAIAHVTEMLSVYRSSWFYTFLFSTTEELMINCFLFINVVFPARKGVI